MRTTARARDRQPKEVLPLQPTREGHAVPAGLRPRPAPRPKRRFAWGRWAVAATAVYALWMAHVEWGQYRQFQAQSAALQREAAQLRLEHGQLAAEVAYAGTNQYVAAAARQEFGLVGPGEVPLAPIATGSAQTASGG